MLHAAVGGVLGGRAHRELVQVGLAGDHARRRARSRSHRRRVERRDIALEDPRSAGGRLLDGDDVVLERDRHARERPARRHRVDPRRLGLEQRLPTSASVALSPAASAAARRAAVSRATAAALTRPPSRRAAAPGRSRRRTRAPSPPAAAPAAPAGTSARSATCAGPGRNGSDVPSAGTWSSCAT